MDSLKTVYSITLLIIARQPSNYHQKIDNFILHTSIYSTGYF